MHSYRMAHAGHTSASASGSVKSGYAPIELHADGDDAAASAGRSSSPVSNVSLSGDEVTLPSRRSTRRSRSHAAGVSSDGEDHVRFDEHVSYIHRTDRSASPTDAADFP